MKDEFKDLKSWASEHATSLVLGGIGGFMLIAWLLTRKKQKVSPGNAQEPNLNMERYIFDIPVAGSLETVVVEAGGECYSVSLDGKHLGTMYRDEDLGLEWNTTDEALKDHLWDIAAKLSEAFSRKGFPSLLKGAYAQILKTDWKTEETLEVTVDEDTDLEVFTTFLTDEILNIVDFEEHLDLLVKKPDSTYFKIVGIN